MKKFLLGTVALVALSLGSGFGPAVAADMRAAPRMQPAPMYAPIYNWSGFYLGGHIGFGFNNNDDFVGFSSDDSGGFMAGGQIGFDVQMTPNWVVGIEGQLSWVDFDNSWVAPGLALARNNDWLGSVTGRLGYTWGPGLLYVKGGVAFADNEYQLLVAGVPTAFTSGDNSSTGWTLGAGLEYMFAPSWSAKLEYQYYNFGSDALIAPIAPFTTGVSVDQDVHTVKLGVNYRFNWGAPVVAKY